MNRKRRHIGERLNDTLLRELLAGRDDVTTIAERHRLSPHRIIAWSRRPETKHALGALIELSNAQAQAALCRYRPAAAIQLANLATSPDIRKEQDIQRRACMDVLKSTVGGDPRPEDEVSATDAAAVLEHILAQSAEHDDAKDDAQGDHP